MCVEVRQHITSSRVVNTLGHSLRQRKELMDAVQGGAPHQMGNCGAARHVLVVCR